MFSGIICGFPLNKSMCAKKRREGFAIVPFSIFRQQQKSTSEEVLLVEEDGFEPSKHEATDLQSAPFGRSGTLPYKTAYFYAVELVMGLEPATC